MNEKNISDFKLLALLFLLVLITGFGFIGYEMMGDYASGYGGFSLGIFVACIIYFIIQFNKKDDGNSTV